jgi:Tol biopolymer transport system component/tRNA A-37 threonylcarbamoyl transferase component Bud32
VIGKTISHYRILEKLGGGGMGVVYKGRDTLLDRQVAIKVLSPELLADETAARGFIREAKAASALNHPNILTVHDLVEAEGVHFLVMEFVEGQTLRARIGKKGMELKPLLDISLEVAEALAAAHRAGIVHRDLKPENIMVRADGHVKVVDFGLAKLLGAREQTQVAVATQDVAVTASGAPSVSGGLGARQSHIAGTLPYMSPEQLTGKALDHRTDIFSFGVVLYEMATGQQPFHSRTTGELIEAILGKEPPPVTELSRVVPDRLQEMIAKALEKDPTDRYQGMEDLVVDLRRLKRVTDTGRVIPKAARPPAPALATIAAFSRRKLAVLAGGAVLAVVLMALGLYRFLRQRESPAPFQTMTLRTLTSTGKLRDAIISPDGKYLAYATADAGMESLWVRQIATASSVQIIPPAEAGYVGLTFSSDGNYVYYVKGERKRTLSLGTLYEVPVLGGPSRKLIEDVESPVTTSPDGKQFAFVRGSPDHQETALVVVNADGTGERKLASRKSPAEFSTDGPAWSPDGKIIALGSGDTVVAVRVEDGKEETLASKLRGDVGRVAWLADGSGLLLIALDDASRAQIWQLVYPSGQVHRITNDTNDYADLSLTADSKAIVAVSGRLVTRIWVFPKAEPGRARELNPGTGELDGFFGLSWTPGGRIVYTSLASEPSRVNLWAMDPDGSNLKQLTVGVDVGMGISVCPDGRYIVYRAGAGPGIWRMDLDGSNQKQLTKGENDFGPRCSPDGKWVVYRLSRAGTDTLWKVPIDGGAPVQITDKPSRSPAFSPDGKWIACVYRGDPSQPEKLAVLSFQGGPPAKIFEVPPVGSVDWTPDGRALSFVARNQGVVNIWLQPLAGGPPKQLTDLKAAGIFLHRWSPDGKQLALAYGTRIGDAVLISNFKGSEK